MKNENGRMIYDFIEWQNIPFLTLRLPVQKTSANENAFWVVRAVVQKESHKFRCSVSNLLVSITLCFCWKMLKRTAGNYSITKLF